MTDENENANEVRATVAGVLAGAGRYRVEQGDCLAFLARLPDESVDALVTDPPYCAGGVTESERRGAKSQGVTRAAVERLGWFDNDNMGTAGLVWMLRQVAIEASRVLRRGASMLVFCDWRMHASIAPALESTGLRYQQLVVWDKGAAGLGVGFRSQHELVLHFVKGTGVFHDRGTGNVLREGRVHSSRKRHPTEKPVPLIARMLPVICAPGGVVVDPFCGSGPMGEAALEGGYRVIACDRSATHVATTEARCAAVVRALDERSRGGAAEGTG